MSRPIPIDIIPSHIHLSEADQVTLFGASHALTIGEHLSQTGQVAYEESLNVRGTLKRSISLRVLGPCRENTQVELTPTEAQLLGIVAPTARSGDNSEAADCMLDGPLGNVRAVASVIIPQPHLHCSDAEAAHLRLQNGKMVTVDIVGDRPCILHDVVVRVHPTYRIRLHIHPDLARENWLTGVMHGRIRENGL